VEVETDDGAPINAGKWIDRGDGYWVLKITDLPNTPPNTKLNPKQAICICKSVGNMGGAPKKYHSCIVHETPEG